MIDAIDEFGVAATQQKRMGCWDQQKELPYGRTTRTRESRHFGTACPTQRAEGEDWSPTEYCPAVYIASIL